MHYFLMHTTPKFCSKNRLMFNYWRHDEGLGNIWSRRTLEFCGPRLVTIKRPEKIPTRNRYSDLNSLNKASAVSPRRALTPETRSGFLQQAPGSPGQPRGRLPREGDPQGCSGRARKRLVPARVRYASWRAAGDSCLKLRQ